MLKRRVTVRGIIVDGQKIFAQQLHKSIEKGGNWWCTPGGGIDPGEDLITALHREMIEETGVAPEIGNLIFIQQYKENEELELLEFFFHITNAEDYKHVDLSKTTHGEQEVANYGFVDPVEVNLLPKELQTMDISAHIKQKLAVKIVSHL